MAELENGALAEQLRQLKNGLEETGIQSMYEEAVEKVLQIIRAEVGRFEEAYHREMVSSITGRIKKAESIQKKLYKKGCTVDAETAMLKLHDIAGVRVACFFLDDVYTLAELLRENQKLRILKEKNYIAEPKNSGYQSLHLIVEVSLERQDIIKWVKVEIQLRTLAMDFWADIDHRLCYKKDCKEARDIQKDLREYAEIISRVDGQMNRLLHKIF